MTDMGKFNNSMSKTGGIPAKSHMNMTGGIGKVMGKTGMPKGTNQFDDIGEIPMKPENYG